MAVGQIVYNLEDYHQSGGLISTSGVDIFSNVVSQINQGPFKKVGIQAPAGTKFILNQDDSNKTMMVGRTGVYELDEDIAITGLYFVRPYKYVLDQGATDLALGQGQQGMDSAETKRANAMEALNNKYGANKNNEYWAEYTAIQDTFISEYESASAQYIQGINGIYVLPNPSNPKDSQNYDDLYNVIVDFLY